MVSTDKLNGQTQRKPEWIRSKLPTGERYAEIRDSLKKLSLHTVCEEARCPNLAECWEKKTATMMILGDTCTRGCRFCNVKTGIPQGVDVGEIDHAVRMVEVMGLKYLVITSVDRDDLPDFGSSHFANVVAAVSRKYPETMLEVLVPDFGGVDEHMHTLAKSNPFVVAQNVEVVERLTKQVRDPRAGYKKSLDCLSFYKREYPHIHTKSSLMVGLGETKNELKQAAQNIYDTGASILTFGQYLRPSRRNLPVLSYYTPEEFDELKEMAYEIGFDFVASGPMVRSSYRAADYLKYLNSKKNGNLE